MKKQAVRELQFPNNLIAEVDAVFAKLNHPKPTAWQVYLSPEALLEQNPEYQRFYINRCLRRHIADEQVTNTMDLRYAIIDSGSLTDWIHLLESNVLPCMLKLNLPRLGSLETN